MMHLTGAVVKNEQSGLKNLVRRIDEGAARLNPGLSAIAIVLLTLVTGEAAVRFVSVWAYEVASQTVRPTIDPTLSAPSDIPLDD